MARPSARSNVAFATVWSAQSVSVLGSSAASFALGLFIFSNTGQTSYLALITGVSTFGGVYLSPICGAVADHFPKRTVILGCNALHCAVATTLAVLTFRDPDWFVWAAVPLVFLAALLSATVSVALTASVRTLRSEADLTRINGLTSFLETAPVLAGPLVGAALYAVVHPGIVFVVDAFTFLVSFAMIAVLPWTSPPKGAVRKFRPFSGAAAGVRYIASRPEFMRLQGSFAVFNFMNGFAIASTTAFIVSESTESSGPWNLASVSVAGAVGLTFGSALVLAVGRHLDRGLTIVWAIVLGASIGRVGLVMTVIPAVWIGAHLVRGFTTQLMNGPLTAIWQERIPEDRQATVFGARRLIGQGPYPIAVLLGGFAVEFVESSDRFIDRLARWTPFLQSVEAAGEFTVIVVAGVGELLVAVFLLGSPGFRRLAERSTTVSTRAANHP